LRKEYFFFLILLLAAAVVIGATIGMIGNLNYIIHQTDIIEPLQSTQNEQGPDTVEEQPASISENAVNTHHSQSNIIIDSSSGSIDSELLIVSNEEQAEVAGMLTKLGIDEGKPYNERIAAFQKKYSMEPTGNLDSLTLNAIVEKMRLQQTSNRAKA